MHAEDFLSSLLGAYNGSNGQSRDGECWPAPGAGLQGGALLTAFHDSLPGMFSCLPCGCGLDADLACTLLQQEGCCVTCVQMLQGALLTAVDESESSLWQPLVSVVQAAIRAIREDCGIPQSGASYEVSHLARAPVLVVDLCT